MRNIQFSILFSTAEVFPREEENGMDIANAIPIDGKHVNWMTVPDGVYINLRY